MISKLYAILKLSRPLNCIITFLVILVAYVICADDFILTTGILAGIAGLFSAAGGNVINDYFDIEIDRINRPDRALPSNIISPNCALIVYSIYIIASLLVASLIGLIPFGIVALANIILFFYSKNLKRVPLIGNITVAFFTGLAFVFGGVAATNPLSAIIPAIFAFLVNLIREMVKDIQDIEGDRKENAITFPIKYGITKTILLIKSFSLLLILVTLIPYIFEFYKIEFFLIIMVLVNPIFLYLFKNIDSFTKRNRLNLLSNLLKISMLFGLLAIYMGNI